ncbi:glucose-1-phosphate adenylyltransferase [Acetoanaerobium noterae]|uniref:Glucose-1-phosphate adenylyltransferase n=1 Tax=Acetoanaerobium noterae TaxID=745369 RepID=A0A1T5CA56_9FIRM|nr:glucose-1-phosphate adenylyltransferase subunit GlgD [Acetoanaerobium noterae]SKB56236.1 glucose-1-phosphate adenylyltransferase [Acetoanaerobium noterae]
MLKNCQGIINLSENEYNIKKLVNDRPIASIPIAGRYRVIDFVLSNMVNAGIQNVGIFTDYNHRSLLDHTNNGKAWDLDRKIDGLFIFSPNFNPLTSSVPRGDIHNFYSNLDYIRLSKQEYVLISCSYMIANIDFRAMYQNHIKDGADISIAYTSVHNADTDFERCYLLNLGKTGRVVSVGVNMGHRKSADVSMEVYLMKKELLLDIIMDSIAKGENFYLNDAINQCINTLKITAYNHKGYVKCINSIEKYFEANMDFLNTEISEEIFYSERKIYTKVKDESPTFYSKDAKIDNSLIANGCIIEGEIKNSVIFRRVHVEKGAKIENSIIMQNGLIKSNANLQNVILDKGVVISENKELKGDKKVPLVIDKNRTI